MRKLIIKINRSLNKIKNLIAPCPPATQDLELNTKNRDAAVKAEHIQYGPLNVDEPGNYWKDIADSWNTSEEAAKKSLCGNCVAFDISPRMKECMPGETSDEDGELGYCWMHHFKCHSARSCRTWAKGGPIKEDNKSAEWQGKANLEESAFSGNGPLVEPVAEGEGAIIHRDEDEKIPEDHWTVKQGKCKPGDKVRDCMHKLYGE